MYTGNIQADYNKDEAAITGKVENKNYLSNYYIWALMIDTINTVTGTTSSSKAVKNLKCNALKEGTWNTSEDLKLSINSMPLFYYIKSSQSPPMDAPCGHDEIENYIGYTWNRKDIYDEMLCALKDLDNNDCNINIGLINKYLLLKAIEIAFDAGDLSLGKELYLNYYDNTTRVSTTLKSCKCKSLNQ